jgi:hypothetical protein
VCNPAVNADGKPESHRGSRLGGLLITQKMNIERPTFNFKWKKVNSNDPLLGRTAGYILPPLTGEIINGKTV